MAVPADIFNRAPPHGLIQDWLGSDTAERLLWFAQANEHLFQDSEVRRERLNVVDHVSRMSKTLSINKLEADLRPQLEQLLPLIFDRLGIKPFIPDETEMELVAHGDGAFFARHIDTFTYRQRRSRAISAVYYFHTLPKAFSGGVLRLHSLAANNQRGTFVDILPDRDTLVFFPSFFPHEVLPVKCPSGQFRDSRFAINFWIYRKIA